jgi:hypothetical protein
MPVASHVVEAVAVSHGVCVQPVPVRRIDPETGESTIVDIPCGNTLESHCPPCAEVKRQVRMAQFREGWHLDEEPVVEEDDPDEVQRELATLRADLEAALVLTREEGRDEAPVLAAIEQVDEDLARAGVRGSTVPNRTRRRARSTRRRQDVPDLPRRRVDPRTVGRTYRAPDGKVFRPSIFLTLTCRSYGRVDAEGVPLDMERYDYQGQVRDSIHFAKLVDRFFQNARRFVGYEVQYCATLEPQRRLAPHLHALLRGTVSRADLKRIVAATYHQVWWPQADVPVYTGRNVPVWDEDHATYVDRATGEALPTWEEALDAIAEDEEPMHLVRFGSQVRAEGVLGGSPQAERCINYVGKYMHKGIGEVHEATTPRQQEHLQRLWEAFRYEPCSPTCANWLRYGVQPKGARSGMEPGFCRGKAHRHETLGFGGRRVLVSRKWSGKTLADHRADRRNWVRGLLGLDDDPDSSKYLWIKAAPSDPDVQPKEIRLMLAIADRTRWKQEREAALQAAQAQPETTAA